MKLVLVSDIHGNLNLAKEAAKLANHNKCSILCAGDIFNWELKSPEKNFSKALKLLNSCKKKVYVIPGNHEDVLSFLSIVEHEYKHLVGMQTGVVKLGTHVLVCYGGGDLIADDILNKSYFRINPKSDEMLLKSMLLQKKPVILMTHIPPYSYMDVAVFKYSKPKNKKLKGIYPATPDEPGAIKKHVGDKTLKRIAETYKPQLYLFGHIHGNAGAEELGTHKRVKRSSHLLVNSAGKVTLVELTNTAAKILS